MANKHIHLAQPRLTGYNEVLQYLTNRVPQPKGIDRIFFGIDGPSCAGKSTLAANLAKFVARLNRPVIVISIDGFLYPKAIRHQPHLVTGDGLLNHSYDYSRFLSYVYEPLKRGGSGQYCPGVYDKESDQLIEPAWLSAPSGAIIIIEGVFLHREELRHIWDISVFLAVDEYLWVERRVRRDRVDKEWCQVRQAASQNIYESICDARDMATIVIRMDDFNKPTVVKGPGFARLDEKSTPRASSESRLGLTSSLVRESYYESLEMIKA